MRFSKSRQTYRKVVALLAVSASLFSCSEADTIPLTVSVPGLSVSKLPFVIAMDQGLYAKYGLDVELRAPTPESGGQNVSHGNFWGRVAAKLYLSTPRENDINVNGGNPMVVRVSETGPEARQIMLGATDCVIRAHIIGRKGIRSLDELKGGRIGVSSLASTSGYHALLLAERMGWDPKQDISLLVGFDDEVAALLDGRLDALVAYESAIADAKKEGLPVLLDLCEWGGEIAGNSINVGPDWLGDPTHREAARRFFRATAEAIALYHQQPQLVQRVLAEWYGISDPQRASVFYELGSKIPRKPYPCYDGIKNALALYDSNEMRRYKATDFYDDSVMRELDASGFIDALYAGRPTADPAPK